MLNIFKGPGSEHRRRGQGMVEYIIIVVVVGIFCIGIFMALGKGVESQVGQSTSKLVGTTEYDAELDSTEVTNRVENERFRENLMKGN